MGKRVLINQERVNLRDALDRVRIKEMPNKTHLKATSKGAPGNINQMRTV